MSTNAPKVIVEFQKSKRLLVFVVLLVFFIWAVNSVAMKFDMYWIFWWFDMPMHFLGGVFIGFVSILLIIYGRMTFYIPKTVTASIIYVFFSALIIGVGWEVFEVIVDTTIIHNGFNMLDTLSDLSFDISGALLGLLYILTHNAILYTEEYESTIY